MALSKSLAQPRCSVLHLDREGVGPDQCSLWVSSGSVVKSGKVSYKLGFNGLELVTNEFGELPEARPPCGSLR